MVIVVSVFLSSRILKMLTFSLAMQYEFALGAGFSPLNLLLIILYFGSVFDERKLYGLCPYYIT